MKRFLRGLSKLIGLILGGGIALCIYPFGLFAKYIERYASVALLLSFIPTYVGEYARYVFYKLTLKALGKKVVFKFGSFCEYPDITIGNHVTVGYYTSLGLVNIGSDVVIGKKVDFLSGLNQHSFSDPAKKIRLQESRRSHINIGSDIWGGSNSSIAADVCDRCVIGVGAVLVKPVLEKGVYAGNPAKKIADMP